ncbi:MAG: pyridoxamine 5'-phosphate oxidase family protein [Clostridia bacterium]|nr:pyridoxamine 5'-phosphate oxidase family protein [Clostridia bacterium]
MRRKDREMDREFGLMVLGKCEWAVLATVNADGTPYCIPVTIVNDDTYLYFHSALGGQKVENLRRQSAVCLTAVGDTQIALDKFTTEYECAVVTGTAEEVTEDAAKMRALRLLCQRHVPTHMDRFDEEAAGSLKRTGVWRVPLTSVTGKRKKYGN